MKLPACGLALWALVGCASQPATMAPATAPASASPPVAGAAGTRFDGTFTGLLGAPVSANSRRICYQSGAPKTLRVVNGTIRGTILYRMFDAPLGADGSFNVTGPDTQSNGFPGKIEGRVTATRLDGSFILSLARGSCTYSLNSLTRG